MKAHVFLCAMNVHTYGDLTFSSQTKYDSGSGWPSFYQALGVEGKDESKTNVLRCRDNSHGMSRIEVVCKQVRYETSRQSQMISYAPYPHNNLLGRISTQI